MIIIIRNYTVFLYVIHFTVFFLLGAFSLFSIFLGCEIETLTVFKIDANAILLLMGCVPN